MVKTLLLILLVSINIGYSQNTIGTTTISSAAYDGFTLFTTSTQTYLINNCGEVINEWTSTFPPGNDVYLLENGNILRAGRTESSDITFGGQGGVIEIYNWEGGLIWQYFYDTPLMRQHHDVFPMPNGNVLILAATRMTNTEAIQAGRDPSLLSETDLYNEQIIEVTPVGLTGASVVWEWNINDHLIQDFDNSQENYNTDVSGNPQLLDINFLNGLDGNANWLHINSIQYNETLDQIVFSSRHLSEIYIIDHSTTTAEAKSHSGGIYGKGGDFLYRWGNKESYRQGTSADRTLFAQHYPHWIQNGLNDEGKIMIFNNGTTSLTSSIDIIDPPSSSAGFYTYEPNGYLPTSAEWQYIDPNTPTDFFSAILSSGQRLPNGNTLICDGDSGYFFEIDTNNNKVWEYVNPVATDETLSQGDIPTTGDNIVFRAIKFSEDFAGFTGRDMTPGDPIELNFDIDFCSILSIDDYDISKDIQLFPNPTSNTITVNSNLIIDKLEVYDLYGKLITSVEKSKSISIEQLASGMYFIKVYSANKIGTKKFIKK